MPFIIETGELSNQFSSVRGTRSNQSTITNTIRIGLGNGEEGDPLPIEIRTYSSRPPSLPILPHLEMESERGEKSIHAVVRPNKLSFSLKGHFPFEFPVIHKEP